MEHLMIEKNLSILYALNVGQMLSLEHEIHQMEHILTITINV